VEGCEHESSSQPSFEDKNEPVWIGGDSLCDIGPMPWGDGVVDFADLKSLRHRVEESQSSRCRWQSVSGTRPTDMRGMRRRSAVRLVRRDERKEVLVPSYGTDDGSVMKSSESGHYMTDSKE